VCGGRIPSDPVARFTQVAHCIAMNVHDHLIKDHVQIRQHLQEVQAALTGPSDTLSERLLTLQKAVQSHFRKEDDAYYPVVDADKRLPDRALLHALRNDHAAVIFALESLTIRLRKKVPMSEWQAKFEKMQQVLLSHFDQEEKTLFPLGQKTLTSAEFQSLLEKINALE
jgi:iron-sulfur cluster repair protein YtfE (RIC family)